jgi:hypothetical protein
MTCTFFLIFQLIIFSQYFLYVRAYSSWHCCYLCKTTSGRLGIKMTKTVAVKLSKIYLIVITKVIQRFFSETESLQIYRLAHTF